MKPFFSFYGGKWRAAPHYPPPRFNIIIEPFAGSAGYAVRHFEKKVYLIDKDPIIAGLWTFLIKVKASEILSLPVNVEHVDDLKICNEAKWLIGFWLNKGSAAPRLSPSYWMRRALHNPYMTGGSRPSNWWGEEIRARIAGQVDLIRHWEIKQGDYTDAPLRNDATYFVDPPYSQSGKIYSCKFIAYEKLAQWCRALRGQVIVCEQNGASWLSFQQHCRVKTSVGKKSKGHSEEVIWTNEYADRHSPITNQEQNMEETAVVVEKKKKTRTKKSNGEKRTYKRLSPSARVARQFAKVQKISEKLAAAKEKLVAMIG